MGGEFRVEIVRLNLKRIAIPARNRLAARLRTTTGLRTPLIGMMQKSSWLRMWHDRLRRLHDPVQHRRASDLQRQPRRQCSVPSSFCSG
jgi:hypothetical protein